MSVWCLTPRSTKRRLKQNIWQPKTRSFRSWPQEVTWSDQFITGFKMILCYQNMGTDTSYVQISVISAEIWHKTEFSVMAGHFVPVYTFSTIKSNVPSYNRLYDVIWSSKPGCEHLICTDFIDKGRYRMQNIIFGTGGTFCPGLPFSDHFDKGTPL